jgi:hypothetical protein
MPLQLFCGQLRKTALNGRDSLFSAAWFYCIFFSVDEFFYTFSSQSTLPEALSEQVKKSLRNLHVPGIYSAPSIMLNSSTSTIL